MYFEFQCGKCAKKLKVREEISGQKVRCPYCHHTQVVEAPSRLEPADAGGISINTDAPAPRPGASAPAGAAGPQAPAPEKYADATEVNLWVSLGIGLAFFVVFYAIAFLLKSTYFGALFLERGWVQFALVFLLGWSGGILFLKSRKIAVQRDSMLFDLLPEDISKEISVKSVDRFMKHINGLPVRQGESFLVSRVRRGLEHFKILQNSGEVADRLSVQSDVDANAVGSSYTIVKIFIWAIPILGFIGTVIGISAAVGGFSGGLEDATDVSALKDSLGSVTGGLSTAFDTTLVALVFSMLVMFPTSSMQKTEEDMLNRVDEYTNENLLKRLKDNKSSAPATNGIDPKALQAAIDTALVPHHAELKTWNKKLEAIGDQFAKRMAEHCSKLDEQLRSRQEEALKKIHGTQQALGEMGERLKSIADVQSQTMTDLGERTVNTQEEIVQSMAATAESLQKHFLGLEQGLEALNRVLESLGEKQVVVHTQVAPRRRGWGLFGGRGNGAS